MWFAFSFFVVVVVSTVMFLIASMLLSIQHNGFLDVLILNGGSILFLLLPLSLGLAILRYRLWDIDVIINRTLAAFSAALRNEVDLSQLSEHLLNVVEQAMQPAHVSLWLRPPEHTAKHQGVSTSDIISPHQH